MRAGQSQGLLIGARFVQGIGGAMTSAVILGMIVTMFPSPLEQAKAIAVYSFVAAAGGAVGLLLGGIITQSINWHWIFFVNLPIGIATALLGDPAASPTITVSGSSGALTRCGAMLLVSSLMLGVYTIVEASHFAWGSTHTLGFGAIALALMAGFVYRQAHAASPLVPLRVFRSRTVTGANLRAGADSRGAVRDVLPAVRCTCSGCCTMTRSKWGWRSSRSHWESPRCRWAWPHG